MTAVAGMADGTLVAVGLVADEGANGNLAAWVSRPGR